MPHWIIYYTESFNWIRDFFDRYRGYGETVSLFEDHKQPTVAEKLEREREGGSRRLCDRMRKMKERRK